MRQTPSLLLTIAVGLFATAATAHGQDATKTCVAMALPSVQGVEGSAADVGNAVRDLVATYLNGPSIQVLPLEARLPSQAIAEARQKQCRYFLTATLTRKHGGGMLTKALGQSVGTAAWSLPGGASVGSAVARSAAIGGAQAVSTLATSTKAKDELRIEYALTTADGTARGGPKSEKARAQVDREDLLTPLVERLAADVAASVAKP